MRVRNLVLGLMLGANALTAQSDAFVTAATTAAITTANTVMLASANNARSSEKTIANAVSSTVINSQNTVIVECPLEYERVKENNEWLGCLVPSLEKTLKNSYCQSNKKAMEKLNSTHYEFGQVKSIFEVRGDQYAMIELVHVNK